MAISFLFKQIDHANSALTLVPRRDACLIARTMIEGLYQLLWTSQMPIERAIRWRSFSVIHDWRLMQKKVKEGSVNENGRNVNALQEFGHLHRKKKSVQSADPYHKSWRGDISLANMAELVGRELYDGDYSEMSDWEHWGVQGIGDAISSRTENYIYYTTTSLRVACQSLATAFRCLFQTLEVVVDHFELGQSEAVMNLKSDYCAFLKAGPNIPSI